MLPLLACTNLVHIHLSHTSLNHDNASLFGTVMAALKCLIYLDLRGIELHIPVQLALFNGLLHHPTIVCILISKCKLSSYSCIILARLIPTLTKLKKLDIRHNKLPFLHIGPPVVLKQTAEIHFITLHL